MVQLYSILSEGWRQNRGGEISATDKQKYFSIFAPLLLIEA